MIDIIIEFLTDPERIVGAGVAVAKFLHQRYKNNKAVNKDQYITDGKDSPQRTEQQ